MKEFITKWFENLNFSDYTKDIMAQGVLLIILLIAGFIIGFISKEILIRIYTKITLKSKNQWDDILLEKKFFHWLSYLIPTSIMYYSIQYFLPDNLELSRLIQDILKISIIFILFFTLIALLNAINAIYDSIEKNKAKSIKGFIQVGKIAIYFITGITLFSILTGENAIKIFTGLGAFAAVLLLIFQDPIKGLASGVQLSANDMVRIGDWVSMPKYDADGTVIEIALTTVKIKNWDNTISMIPSYALVSQSFSNWRGMEESGGRRIKRSINIDVNSVHYLDQEEIERLSKIDLLRDYLKEKKQELYNGNSTLEATDLVNQRKLTNIGTFRIYLNELLKQNENINTDMTFMVRQLQSSDKGLPLEIYAFSRIKSWVEYEGIQADLFDHVYASIHTFNLKFFQNPSGSDFQNLKHIIES